MPPQAHNQGSLPISLPTNQSQACQQLSQNMQNSMSSNEVQSSAFCLRFNPDYLKHCWTECNMQSISGVSQNPVGNSMGQGIPSNMFVNSQRQMPGRQQVVTPQQQQQSQNPQQYLLGKLGTTGHQFSGIQFTSPNYFPLYAVKTESNNDQI